METIIDREGCIYTSYVFWGDSYLVDREEPESIYPDGTKFTIIDGEARLIINDMPPNAKLPNYNSGIFNLLCESFE